MRTFALFTDGYCPFQAGEWVELKITTEKTIWYKSVTTKAEIVIPQEYFAELGSHIGECYSVIDLKVSTKSPLIDQLKAKELRLEVGSKLELWSDRLNKTVSVKITGIDKENNVIEIEDSQGNKEQFDISLGQSNNYSITDELNQRAWFLVVE